MHACAQAIDAAKKRAVAQNVDYDTFKNMVHVAHLKPLQSPSAPKMSEYSVMPCTKSQCTQRAQMI